MPELHDNILRFPVPPTRLLRVLLDEARSQVTAERVARRLIVHIERTDLGLRCPWCRLPPPDQDA